MKKALTFAQILQEPGIGSVVFVYFPGVRYCLETALVVHKMSWWREEFFWFLHAVNAAMLTRSAVATQTLWRSGDFWLLQKVRRCSNS